jgi:hypothetical protein
MPVAVAVAEVDGSVGADADRRIPVAVGATRHRLDVPGDAVVLGDGDALLAAAALVWDVDRPVGPDLHVAVKSAALVGIDRHRRVERDAAVVAPCAERRDEILRAVVERMRVDGPGQRRVVRAAADRLMVDAAVEGASLARDPARAVVVGDRRQARRPRELRAEPAAGRRVHEADRVERRGRRSREADVLPACAARRVGVVPAHAKRLQAGLVHRVAGLPIRAERRLAGVAAEAVRCRVVGVGDVVGAGCSGCRRARRRERRARRVAVPVGPDER